MIYYMIRHIASGEFMPELKRGKGYSHWNPATKSIPETSIGVPRILPTKRRAEMVITQWVNNPNARMGGYTTYSGEDDYDIVTKPDGRKKEDLEVVEVIFYETSKDE